MIFLEELNTNKGVLVVRSAGTPRPEDLDQRILTEGWSALLLFSYGDLLFEAWGRMYVEFQESSDEFASIAEAAVELGMSTEELVARMVEDGLFLETSDGLIASPHPDLRRISSC
ncbi:hypothetical protein [Corynebacterium pilbarense]|uniref:hypothetical protein n=1 Tax=Corynebacterium pilbarense TaxID=1288393 RepID=UPI0022A930F9|nr:hypothetical protein [Corynebacterium pilbarense]